MNQYTGKNNFVPESGLPGISIVMPTYQGGPHLPSTLASLTAQDYPSPVELIAVDSGSTDNTLALLEAIGATVLRIPLECFGHGYVRNHGVKHAKQPLIVFLSQDAIPVGTSWLRELVEPLCGAADPAIAATYARQLPRPGATPLEIYFQQSLYPAQSRYFQQAAGARTGSLDQFFFSNVCSAAPREICSAYPFDESLIMSEDQAFAKALLNAAYTTFYNAEAQVIHSHHYSLAGLFRRHFDSAYSLRGITNEGWLQLIQKGLAYIAGEIAFVVATRAWGWLIIIPIYEGTRITARVLGRFADYLPRSWRVAFSLHRGYWKHKK